MRDELESYAAALEASGRYRVIRRFSCPGVYSEPESTHRHRGIFLDVETTGVDPERDEVIELAMVPFEYSDDGRIFQVLDAFTGLQDPGKPLTPFVTQLTGLTDSDLQGQRIETDEVRSVLQGTSLIIAHNAQFDRPFFEKTFPELEAMPWACSVKDVPWAELGVEGKKLEYIAYRCGVYFDGHRAEIDCQVGIHVLAKDWLGDGRTALRALLGSVRSEGARIWAVGSPFSVKDLLKARGYRFNGSRKVWYRDLPADDLEAEQRWLASEVYQEELRRRGKVRLRLSRITARERYSRGATTEEDLLLVP